MKRLLLLAATAALPFAVHAQESYRVFTADGTPTTLDALARDVMNADVVFMGEVHDDSVGHVVQDALFGLLLAQSQKPVTLSLEMFERDVQGVLDEYLSGIIPESQFLPAARPWPMYAAHYRPMVEKAREAGRPVLAANAPRRYVNLVSREGPGALEKLSEEARSFLSPLPFVQPTEAYQAKWNALMAEMGHDSGTSASGPSNMLLSQSLWDATMAHTIARYLMARPGDIVVHLVGGFHVEGKTGTPEALLTYRPGTDLRVIAVQPADDITVFSSDYNGLGDYIVLTDAALLPPRDF